MGRLASGNGILLNEWTILRRSGSVNELGVEEWAKECKAADALGERKRRGGMKAEMRGVDIYLGKLEVGSFGCGSEYVRPTLYRRD